MYRFMILLIMRLVGTQFDYPPPKWCPLKIIALNQFPRIPYLRSGNVTDYRSHLTHHSSKPLILNSTPRRSDRNWEPATICHNLSQHHKQR